MTWLKTIFGFVFPSWAVYLLAGTLILGAIGAIYAKGSIDRKHRDEITALKLELEQEREISRKLTQYIARLEKAAKEDAEEKAKDDATITELKTKLTEFVETVSDPDHECFSGSDIDGLLAIWGKGQGRAGHHQGR
jgi:uncharacterized protein HemX